MKCFGTIENVPKQSPEIFLAQSEMFPNKKKMFRNTLKCSKTKSWMFQNFSIVLMFQYNSEMFFQTYLKYFTDISEIFWNIMKCFQTNLKYFLIIQNIIKYLTLFIWVLFHANTLRCSQTNLNVSKHSKMFRTFLDCFLSLRILWIILNLSKFSNVLV